MQFYVILGAFTSHAFACTPLVIDVQRIPSHLTMFVVTCGKHCMCVSVHARACVWMYVCVRACACARARVCAWACRAFEEKRHCNFGLSGMQNALCAHAHTLCFSFRTSLCIQSQPFACVHTLPQELFRKDFTYQPLFSDSPNMNQQHNDDSANHRWEF